MEADRSHLAPKSDWTTSSFAEVKLLLEEQMWLPFLTGWAVLGCSGWDTAISLGRGQCVVIHHFAMVSVDLHSTSPWKLHEEASAYLLVNNIFAITKVRLMGREEVGFRRWIGYVCLPTTRASHLDSGAIIYRRTMALVCFSVIILNTMTESNLREGKGLSSLHIKITLKGTRNKNRGGTFLLAYSSWLTQFAFFCSSGPLVKGSWVPLTVF